MEEYTSKGNKLFPFRVNSFQEAGWVTKFDGDVSHLNITETCLYNFDPLKPHFYIGKLGFTGVYIIFLTSAETHRLWVLVRTASPRRF